MFVSTSSTQMCAADRLFALQTLSNIMRYKSVCGGTTPSVAAHSHMTAVVAVLLALQERPLCFDTAGAVALRGYLHDVPEILTGDSTPMMKSFCIRHEQAAWDTLMQGSAFHQLSSAYEGYNLKRSFADRIAKAADTVVSILEMRAYTPAYAAFSTAQGNTDKKCDFLQYGLQLPHALDLLNALEAYDLKTSLLEARLHEVSTLTDAEMLFLWQDLCGQPYKSETSTRPHFGVTIAEQNYLAAMISIYLALKNQPGEQNFAGRCALLSMVAPVERMLPRYYDTDNAWPLLTHGTVLVDLQNYQSQYGNNNRLAGRIVQVGQLLAELMHLRLLYIHEHDLPPHARNHINALCKTLESLGVPYSQTLYDDLVETNPFNWINAVPTSFKNGTYGNAS